MPIFDFICRSCGKKFETLILNNKEKVSCVDCGSGNVERLFSTKFGIGRASSLDFSGIDSGVLSSSRCGSCVSKSCSTCS